MKIPNHSYRILVIGGSEYEKIKVSLNLISHQADINKKILTCRGSIWCKMPIAD